MKIILRKPVRDFPGGEVIEVDDTTGSELICRGVVAEIVERSVGGASSCMALKAVRDDAIRKAVDEMEVEQEASQRSYSDGSNDDQGEKCPPDLPASECDT